MRPRRTDFTEQDRAVFRVTTAFLNQRLEERATIDWALRLRSDDTVKRLALLDRVDSLAGRKLNEPWRTAWRLIEESWDSPAVEDRNSTVAFHIEHRIKAGDRSGALISALVELVAPRLEVKPFSDIDLQYRKLPKRPRSVEHLLLTSITSGKIIDPDECGLTALDETGFLAALANALDAVVMNGLDIARRLGWNDERPLWQLGQLHRVYFVPPAERPAGEHEPDEFHYGIAPSVKLLHATVSRLAALADAKAVDFARRWRATHSLVHRRLWAALSRNPRIARACEVSAFLLELDDRAFWNLHYYPEIAELRARRFAEISGSDRQAILARIRKCPPRSQWPKKVDTERVSNARLYWAVRELRRIEVAGSLLPSVDKAWLSSRIDQFPDLIQMVRVDEGFLGMPKAQFIPPNPDSRYDFLSGEERLKALEAALSSTRGGWDDDPAERASDWIRQQGNPTKILNDLESVVEGGKVFGRVWERFGWSHAPTDTPADQAAGNQEREAKKERDRVLALLMKLPAATVREAIGGISHWLSAWAKQIFETPNALTIWMRIWPIAVQATNAQETSEDNVDSNIVGPFSDDREPMDLDTLNCPAGKLIGVFLAGCPAIQGSQRPFDADGPLRTMRDTIILAPGRSGVIGKHRLIEHLPYFLYADPDWTRANLIPPLLDDTVEAPSLWRAVARQRLSFEVMNLLGEAMIKRAVDPQIGRETRQSLVFRIVVECLHALKDAREPAVPHARIQQMLRSLDDEVRAHGAEAIKRFVSEVAGEAGNNMPSPEVLLRSAAAPFLQQVWPQERSLSTPGVSRALADLPAASRGAFTEAVDAIQPFLVPFECWSMVDYGLFGNEDGEAKLENINTPKKAAAFLRLLDHTISSAETAVVPYDLSDALDQVNKVAPKLANGQIFRRLATAARRV
jgi:hypothetical protein